MTTTALDRAHHKAQRLGALLAVEKINAALDQDGDA